MTLGSIDNPPIELARANGIAGIQNGGRARFVRVPVRVVQGSSRTYNCGDRCTPLQVARKNNDQANGNNANSTGVNLMDLYETSSDVYSLGVLCTISHG